MANDNYLVNMYERCLEQLRGDRSPASVIHHVFCWPARRTSNSEELDRWSSNWSCMLNLAQRAAADIPNLNRIQKSNLLMVLIVYAGDHLVSDLAWLAELDAILSFSDVELGHEPFTMIPYEIRAQIDTIPDFLACVRLPAIKPAKQ